MMRRAIPTMRRMVAMLAALAPLLAHAEQTPPPGKFDPRMRTVAYNRQDIVTINTYYGVSTAIQFADDERVEPKSQSAGDRAGWTLSITERQNILFLQPKAENPDTNLTIVTNKRVYFFFLNLLRPTRAAPGKAGKKGDGQSRPAPDYSMAAMRSKNLTISLTFTYPDDERARASADQARAAKKQAAEALRRRLASGRAHAANKDYWWAGDDAIAPSDARDDGRFIYLTFARNRDLPSIEGIDANGKPFALNVAVDGNTVIIERMVRRLVLRKGAGPDGLAVCVVNRSFNPDSGIDASTGTVATDVLRVLKEAEQ